MQLTTQTIKAINSIIETAFDWENQAPLKGWSVNTDTGEVYDISSDSGGGHHAGYTDWLQTNHNLVGLSKDDADWIYNYFVNGDNIDDNNPRMNSMNQVVGNDYDALIEKIKPIYTNHFRAVLLFDILDITILNNTPDIIKAVIDFVIRLDSAHKLDYWIVTYDDKLILRSANLNELMELNT